MVLRKELKEILSLHFKNATGDLKKKKKRGGGTEGKVISPEAGS